jgi:glycosyltransferase involved in cell wall biosynthesis
MHILIIHQAFASLDEPGGTRHYEFACWLAERGHKVTVIASPVSYITGQFSNATSGSAVAFESSGVVTILRVRVYSAHHKSFAHRVLAFFSFMWSSFWMSLAIPDVDLVWGTSPPIFQAVTAWLLARLKGARFLFEVRDLWPQFAVAAGVLQNRLLIAASEWLERFLLHRADCVMVNSPGFVQHVGSRGVRRVELVANGADPDMFDPASDGAAFRLENALDGKFVVLYAGAHGLSNDLHVVLDAARLLQGTSVQIVLVGDGKEKPALQSAARDLSNVTFAPPAPKRQMPGVLAAADACLAILKPLEEYKTTYPNKVFDYMAAGRPVLLAIDGVIRDVVDSAGCGIFISPGNPAGLAAAVRKLATNRPLARSMGANGRKYLEQHFSRDVIAGRLLEILERTITRRPSDDRSD